MSFISRELEKLGRALREAPDGNRRAELYAAQQALAWAMEPDGFATPFTYLMGIPEGSEDCPACPNPLSS